MQKITFEDLPQAIGQLIEKIDSIEKSLAELKLNITGTKNQELMNIQEAAQYLNLAVPTIYSMVSRGELPHMKRSRRLYFSQTDLMAYIRAGRHQTYAEIRSSALDCLIKPRRA